MPAAPTISLVAPTLAGGMDAMLARLGTGLLVTELMGQGINMRDRRLLARRGGLLGRERRLQYPVAEITIAGNLRDMLLGIAAVGDDIDARGGTRVGSILLQDMTIAGD